MGTVLFYLSKTKNRTVPIIFCRLYLGRPLDKNLACDINRNDFYLRGAMQSYLQVLKGNHLKITPRRKAVIGIFVRCNSHLSPYDVHAKLKKKLSMIGLPTVYRILAEFKNTGILVQSLSDDRQLRYALCTRPNEHHHHFTCRKCHKVEEVEYCNIKDVSRFIKNKLNAKVEAHQLQIEGLCSKCK
jgi:Fe2+ or Zn2+ uptake regulation protein